MIQLELEKTYLAKHLPENLNNYPSKEIVDIYIPAKGKHPTLRLRKIGNRFEITKKQPVKDGDASEQEEHTISLTEPEFLALAAVDGKKSRKIRYYYIHGNQTAEIDVFQDDLRGLVLVDFEFNQSELKNTFVMPEFCSVDVTQETMFAGGMLCGKKYADIEKKLNELEYKPIL